MAPADEQRLITPISQRQFELYALSLERGPNFEPAQIFGAYQAGRGSTSGCILLDPTHWFERDGDIECSTMWANSVLSSVTHLRTSGEAGATSGAPREGTPS